MGYVRTIATIVTAAAFTVGVVDTTLLQQSLAAGAAGSESAGFGVGDTLPPDQVHIITNPGLYGLGPEPAGSKYAVAGGKLIRINPKTGKVLSILRSQSEILD
ncbi:hypothetical protein [Paracoccus alkanivorans]|uniref:Uncharacterized protein n=1 Tax=Paracoccus alkanivorans TaxID=2116655 RepID=A0A3M0MLE8_9RHOB|nr:hypothetical protein [Paracoccus alkanivorans]RMC37883.1 hypothetical protein C9E81_03915 [Paracoccus alkanivorans]